MISTPPILIHDSQFTNVVSKGDLSRASVWISILSCLREMFQRTGGRQFFTPYSAISSSPETLSIFGERAKTPPPPRKGRNLGKIRDANRAGPSADWSGMAMGFSNLESNCNSRREGESAFYFGNSAFCVGAKWAS